MPQDTSRKKRRLLISQSSNNTKEIEIDNIKVEILTREESNNHSWTTWVTCSSNKRRPRSENRIKGALATFCKFKQELTSKSYLFSTPTSLLRHGAHSNDELRLTYLDTSQGTWKNDSIVAAQNLLPFHHTNKKENTRQKTPDKNESKVTEEVGWRKGKEENHGSSEDESASGNSSKTYCDQDTDIAFMKDTDEEIDTADRGRRRMDWKHEEKHRWSHGTDENSNSPMLDQSTQKNEMETSDHIRKYHTKNAATRRRW